MGKESDPSEHGLIIQAGVPPTVEGFLAKAAELGFRVERASRYGFRPEVDRSGTVPTGKPGAPIIGVARMLREVREGKRPFPHGAIGEAAEMLAKIDSAMAAKRVNKDM